MIVRTALLVWIWAGVALADPAADQARTAIADLTVATAALDQAQSGGDRVKALTAAIRATEKGLAAIRESQRQAARRAQVLSDRLAARDAETAALLGTLQAFGRTDSPTVFLHPAGAQGTARAAMLLAEITPALNDQVARLRQDVTDLQDLRALQDVAAAQVQQGLSSLQTAREALNLAITERTDLPQRFRADPIREAILLSTAETLDGFASSLTQIVAEGSLRELPDPPRPSPGSLPLPVFGVLLHAAGEPDAAGITRPGVTLATRPDALVQSPVAATIRYAGPLLDMGQVIILEPYAGSLLILGGLAQSFAKAGQVIPAGDPVGLMGRRGERRDKSSTGGEEGGTVLSETLYIEVRENNTPVDPRKWFALDRTEQDRK